MESPDVSGNLGAIMQTFIATEFLISDAAITPTGMVEKYMAETVEEAVRSCLYTKGLSNGNAKVGPTGRTVVVGNLSYAITAEKPVNVGQRIRMIEMPKDPCPIPKGTEGTVSGVVRVQNSWQISVDWDNGRTLSVVSPPDTFDIIG
jgi:hypothetical protein